MHKSPTIPTKILSTNSISKDDLPGALHKQSSAPTKSEPNDNSSNPYFVNSKDGRKPLLKGNFLTHGKSTRHGRMEVSRQGRRAINKQRRKAISRRGRDGSQQAWTHGSQQAWTHGSQQTWTHGNQQAWAHGSQQVRDAMAISRS